MILRARFNPNTMTTVHAVLVTGSDRPGMLMRKRLLALLREHGEHEVHGWTRIQPVPENATC